MGEMSAGTAKPIQQVVVSGKYSMITRIFLLLCILVAVAYVGNSWLSWRQAGADQASNEQTVIRSLGIIEPSAKHLSSQFTDTQGTLLADAPKDPSQLINPDTLVVGHLEDSDNDSPEISWKAFNAHLAKATGKKVVELIYDNGPEQMSRIRAGEVSVVALHAADVPFLVNNYGYHPVAVLGAKDGAIGNRFDLLVPAASPMQHADDLRGHTLTCSAPSSIVGYRAAVALLMQNQNLRPNVDYFINWSLKQKDSVRGIAKGEYEAAAVSDDKLQSMLAKGDINISEYRILYQSDVIPRTTIGYFYNLKPELAAKIKDAILAFNPSGSSDETPARFLPIDYKKDFALVREIDDRFDPRLDSKTKVKKTATTAP